MVEKQSYNLTRSTPLPQHENTSGAATSFSSELYIQVKTKKFKLCLDIWAPNWSF